MSTAFISHADCLLHEMGHGLPEVPARLQVIAETLQHLGLDASFKHYEAPLAQRDQLLLVHDAQYVDKIFESVPFNGRVCLDPDTWMNPYTLTAALRAAGAAILAVDLVMQQKVNTAFCNVRPPGHHAERDKAMGFCIFNNVAIAAAYALRFYKLKRVAIVDFDVHHGNGTEHIFKKNKKVLLCSSFEHPFYPYCGVDSNSEHIINVPLAAGTAGEAFREKVAAAWFQAIKKFRPEIIFFSAGFDAYYKDHLSNLLLKEEDYAWITREIANIAEEICEHRVISVLEGGYDLDGLGQCAAAHIRNL